MMVDKVLPGGIKTSLPENMVIVVDPNYILLR
jgi:hypothetical protein